MIYIIYVILYIYIYTHSIIYKHICTNICIYIYIYVYVCISVYIYIQMNDSAPPLSCLTIIVPSVFHYKRLTLTARWQLCQPCYYRTDQINTRTRFVTLIFTPLCKLGSRGRIDIDIYIYLYKRKRKNIYIYIYKNVYIYIYI